MKKLISPVLLGIFFGCSEPQEYYTLQDFEMVEKTDVHVHIRTERDAFVRKAQNDNFRLLTIVVDHSVSIEEVREQFEYAIYQKNNHPELVDVATAFGMTGWDDSDWARRNIQWLDSCFQAGAIAIKVWKNIGMVHRDKNDNLIMIDDSKFDPIWEYLTEKDIPVIGHLGEPKNCWLPLEEMTTNNDRGYFSDHPEYHMYKHPEMPSYQEQIDARDRMLEKNPDMTFIGAHLASLEWSVDELATRFDKFPNMAADMAARMGQLFYQTKNNREKVRDFFINYQDRLLYATDMGDSGNSDIEGLQDRMHDVWMRDWAYFTTDSTMTSDLIEGEFQGLKLPRTVVDKIYNENAKKWLGL